MRMKFFFGRVLVALAIASTAVTLPACGKTPAITAETMDEQAALTEQQEAAKVVWMVAPDGQVSVLVKDAEGKPLEKGVSGTVTMPGSSKDASPVTAELVPEPKAGGVLTAKLPKLEGDLTQVNYTLKVNGQAADGVLHLPDGGTKELVESAKENLDPKLEGQKGPNGGVLQVVGDDVIEIVADKTNGNVRVYVLDDSLKPVVVGERKIRLAVAGASAEVIDLTPEPKGLYFQGKLSITVNPVKITVVVTERDRTDVVLCGYHPGTVIVVGPRAPGIAIFVAVNWNVDVKVVTPRPVIVVDHDDVHIHVHKGKGKGKFHHHKKHGRGGVEIRF